MYIVAILELGTPIEAEARALAADLGTIAYEERLKLAGGVPAIVQQTADPEAARTLATALRRRGHAALVVDAADIVASADMLEVRRFALAPDALVRRDDGARLPFADLIAIVRAVHHTRTETRSVTKQRSFSPGRALATGGLLMSKTTRKEERSVADDWDAVLYLFRASGAPPWLVRERGADYAALGPDLSPSATVNFQTVIARLRAAAPHARYDDRLVRSGSAPTRVQLGSPGTTAASSASGVDLIAHLLAQAARLAAQRGPA
ncbi:MAG: hypothetical protein H6709_03740 [Kofleriaceae bacterium]|nr:hypothetical protein [Myxococcales bacterium]MCB9560253.1 hypothetical protein [Kofleriaceae bacterium]MCB9571182.1 hypothetical protein [Kofleriaceae bacterium]